MPYSPEPSLGFIDLSLSPFQLEILLMDWALPLAPTCLLGSECLGASGLRVKKLHSRKSGCRVDSGWGNKSDFLMCVGIAHCFTELCVCLSCVICLSLHLCPSGYPCLSISICLCAYIRVSVWYPRVYLRISMCLCL